MRDYDLDLYDLESLIKYGNPYVYNPCKKVFKNTNERLTEIYENIDFNEKDVFCVMSSSDQVFSAYYLGAKNVDTFDYNLTPYYYFYLRKWYLMFYKKYIINEESNCLLKTLSMYDFNIDEEKQVYRIWKEILTNYKNISNIFINDIYDWNVPFKNEEEKLINIIKDKQANFRKINIFKELETNKKYDIVILSNILEGDYYSKSYEIISANLNKLLKEDGIVICSILNDKYQNRMKEREEFKPYFSYYLSDKKAYNNYLQREEYLYYIYSKKPNTYLLK